MAELWFDFGEPALPDQADPGEDYTLALDFTTAEQAPGLGVRWRVPDTAPTGTCSAAMWRVSDQTLLAFKDFTVSGEQGTNLNIYFDVEDVPTLAASTNYRASIYTPNRYVATTAYGWPEVEGVLTAGAANGWLATEAAYPAIQSGNAANYHVSPIVEISSAVGTLAAALPALTSSLTGTARSAGVVAATLPALTSAITGTAGEVVGGRLTATSTTATLGATSAGPTLTAR